MTHTRPSASRWLRILAASAAGAAGACAHPGASYDDPLPEHDEAQWVTPYGQRRVPPYQVAEERYVVVRQPPPAIRYAAREAAPRPSQRHAWVDGHWRPEGRHYVWVPGAWVIPPRGRGRWVAPRYETRGRQHVYVEGHWL
jgi:hypothetical protein